MTRPCHPGRRVPGLGNLSTGLWLYWVLDIATLENSQLQWSFTENEFVLVETWLWKWLLQPRGWLRAASRCQVWYYSSSSPLPTKAFVCSNWFPNSS